MLSGMNDAFKNMGQDLNVQRPSRHWPLAVVPEAPQAQQGRAVPKRGELKRPTSSKERSPALISQLPIQAAPAG